MTTKRNFKRLDVRPMIARGEEPFPIIRQAVEGLAEGDGLVVIAPFLPSPLIDFLGSQGYASRIERGQGPDWVVYFWKEAA